MLHLSMRPRLVLRTAMYIILETQSTVLHIGLGLELECTFCTVHVTLVYASTACVTYSDVHHTRNTKYSPAYRVRVRVRVYIQYRPCYTCLCVHGLYYVQRCTSY